MAENKIQELEAKIKNQEITIYKLAKTIKDSEGKHKEELSNLTSQLTKKDDEIRNQAEKIKLLEKKSDEIFKNISITNIANVDDLKIQYDKESQLKNQLLKDFQKNLEEKSSIISSLNEEIIHLRNTIEEERNRYSNLFKVQTTKSSMKSSELQFIEISSENTALKTKIQNLKDIIDRLNEQIKQERTNKLQIDENLTKIKENLLNEINLKNNSYKILLKDYQATCEALEFSTKNLEKTKFLYKATEEDKIKLEKNVKGKEDEIIELKAENGSLKSRMKIIETELDKMTKKSRELEGKLSESKLAKQVFDVTYEFLKMELSAQIIMLRENKKHYLIIENRNSSRKFSFFDIEIKGDQSDPNKFYIRIIRENKEEVYMSKDIPAILEYYDIFKKRAIETEDYISPGVTETNESEKKVVQAKENLKKLFIEF